VVRQSCGGLPLALNSIIGRTPLMQSAKATLLLDMARAIAAENPAFQEVLGPRDGDHHTRGEIVGQIQARAYD
jgi:hypothetical protein